MRLLCAGREMMGLRFQMGDWQCINESQIMCAWTMQEKLTLESSPISKSMVWDSA